MLQRDNLYVLKNHLASYFGELKRNSVNDGSHTWHYIEGGERTSPTLLFVHGTMGYKAQWRGLMQQLSYRYHVVAVDIPGLCLGLRHSHEQYDFASQVQYLKNFLTHIGVHRVSLVGHSMGANLAAYFAAVNPHMVSRLILTSVAGLDILADKSAAARFSDFKQLLFFRDYDEFYKAQSSFFHQVPKIPKAIIEQRMNQVLKHRNLTLRVIDDMVRGMEDVINGLNRIVCPSLVINGDSDVFLHPKTHRHLETALSHMQIVTLGRCGHVPFLEYPRQTEQLIRNFLLKPG